MRGSATCVIVCAILAASDVAVASEAECNVVHSYLDGASCLQRGQCPHRQLATLTVKVGDSDN